MNKFLCYDLFLESRDRYSFRPCKISHLIKKKVKIEGTTVGGIKHKVLQRCIDFEINYFTCITNEDTNVHFCNFLPVQIGSKLDETIHRLLFPTAEYDIEEARTFNGYFFVDKSLCHIPNVMTNRKEIIHKTSGISNISLYVYDVMKKGHFFSLDAVKSEIMYKNHRGEMSVVKSDFKFSQAVQINEEHLWPEKFVDGFKFFIKENQRRNIDNISNKTTLSWINILENIFVFIDNLNERCKNSVDHKKDPELKKLTNRIKDIGTNILGRGKLEKFCSQNIEFATSKKDKMKNINSASGFLYRKKCPNQIKFDQKIGCDYVARPSPQNVPKSKIPSGTDFFYCPIDRNISIDLPSRWLLLLEDTIISNSLLYDKKYKTINDIVELLLSCGLIDRSPLNAIPIMVLGGLMTKYFVKLNNVPHLFELVKRKNSFVEIIIKNTFVLLNMECGIVFKKVSDSIFFSALEYENMKGYLNGVFQEGKLFGHNTSSDIEMFAEYISPEKTISANNYIKNRFSSDIDEKYLPLTNESLCAFISDVSVNGESIYDREDSFIHPTMVFCGDPQITADGYILDKNVNINCVMSKQIWCEITYTGAIRKNSNDDMESSGVLVVERGVKIVNVCDLSIIRGTVTKTTVHNMELEKSVDSHNTTRISVYLIVSDSFFVANEDTIQISYKMIREENRKAERVLRIKLFIRGEITNFDGEKLCDESGQKGMVVRQDNSRFKKALGETPHVVASIYSIVNRLPLLELKRLKKENRDTIKDKNSILYGKHKFAILKNITATMKHHSQVRIDNYLEKICETNNVHRTQYCMYQQSFADRKNIQEFLPEENRIAYNMLYLLKTAVKFTDKFGRVKYMSSCMTREDFEKDKKNIEALLQAKKDKKKKCSVKRLGKIDHVHFKPNKNIVIGKRRK